MSPSIKKLKVGVLFLLLFFINGNALEVESSKVYSNGVKDTLYVSESFLKESFLKEDDLGIFLKGYAVLLETLNLNKAQIVRSSAIALKNGYDTKLIQYDNKNYIMFSIEERKADAVYIQKRLSSYNIMTTVKKLSGEALKNNLITKSITVILKSKLDKIIDKQNKRIVELEKILREEPSIKKKLKKSEIIRKTNNKNPLVIKIGTLQVVNRVITEKYIKKYHDTKPFNSYAQKHITENNIKKQITVVAKNIEKDIDKKLPKISSFSRAYKYLRKHAGITKDNILILHGKGYRQGDELFEEWSLSRVNYKKGLIVLNNMYDVPLKRKKIKE